MCLKSKNLFHCFDTNTLIWCDVLAGQVLSMDLNNHNQMRMFKILGESLISFCYPIEGAEDRYILGTRNKLHLIDWDGIGTINFGKNSEVLAEVPGENIRINHARIDKMGRLFFGTMVSELNGEFLNLERRVGSLYRYTSKGGLEQIKEKLGMANGMAWNNAWDKMYLVDSYDKEIYVFDYDVNTGNISEQIKFR